MRLICLTFVVSVALASWASKSSTQMQKLIAPSIFHKISPHLQNSITLHLVQKNISVPTSMINSMFPSFSNISTVSCRITCVNWNPTSGFNYYKQNFGFNQDRKLVFTASFNYSLIIKYETKSWIFPSSTIKIAVNNALIKMKLGYERNNDSIVPKIHLVKEKFGKIKVYLYNINAR